MSDNGFLRRTELRSVLSRIKDRVGSDIASAISESTSSLSSVITLGDSSSVSEAKGYADGLKIIIDSNLSNHTGNTNNPHSVTYSQVGAAAASHTHVEADIIDLGSYASSTHTHTESDITDLGSYASSSHTHVESDITDLGSYALSNHTHTESDITDLGNYANASHSHNLSDINNITASSTEINYLSGATGNIQQQLNSLITSGTTLTLADLGGASATDLSNHTGNTNNPHSVTYTQVGAAPSSHTHTESDITDLGSYAASSHTHILSDILDASSSLAAKSHTHDFFTDITGIPAFALQANLTAHTSDDNNPHFTTYQQVGAAPSSHTHQLSDISDVQATATEVNNVINSKKNIQTQINDCRFYGFFSEWEYEKEYHIGDVIKVPFCKPFIYLECIVDGISGYVQKLTIYNSNDDSIDQEYNYLPWTQQNSFHKNDKYGVIEYTNIKLIDLEDFEVGNTIIDGTTVWIVQDIRDGRLIGEVTYGLTNPNFYTSYNCYGIYPTSTSYNFFDSAFDCKVEMKSIYLKYIRFLKASMMSTVLTGPNGGTSSKPGRFLNLVANTSLSLENGSTWTSSTPNNYGSHIVGAMVIMDWAFNPFTYLDSDHIDNIDPRVFRIIDTNKTNNEFGATYTNTQYIDSAISLKHAINTGLSHGNNSFYLDTNSIGQKYIRFGHYGRIYYSGLPNVSSIVGYIRSNAMTTTTANNYINNNSSALKWASSSYNTSTANAMSSISSNCSLNDLRLDLSKGNSIYGNSTVVQPETVEFELIIKF